MAEVYRPFARVLVVAALLAATATLMLVTVQTARAGALAVGKYAAYGDANGFGGLAGAGKNARASCEAAR